MFEREELISQAHTLLTNLPVDKKVAVIGVVTKDDASVIFALKLNDSWSIQSYASMDEGHGLDYGATVMFSK